MIGSALLLNAGGTGLQTQRPIGAALVRACESVSPHKTAIEIAIGDVEAPHRATETMIAGPVELETGLEGHAPE